MNVWTTSRKVFAEGVRAHEMIIPQAPPLSKIGKPTLTKPVMRRPRRRMFRRLNFGAVPGFGPICLDSNDPKIVEQGFRKRLLRDVPLVDPQRLARLKTFVGAWLDKHVSPVNPTSFEEWLASTSYSEERKVELRKAHESLRGGRPTRRQCTSNASFVKSEYYTNLKHARMINSRHDAFKVWSGPWFKAIENELYRRPEFVKHVPVPDRPQLVKGLRQANTHYYQTDFTAFEGSFTPAVMDALELQLYRHCMAASRKDAEFLCGVISGRNRMSTHIGVHAAVDGRRMSGDMCTSLGNGFSNLMLSMFIAHEKGAEEPYIRGLVEGDDGLFASTVPLESRDYRTLGFNIAIVEVMDPCVASFCGMVFAEDTQIIKDPVKFLCGFGWTHSFIGAGNAIMGQLLRAKALSACYETPHCPIIGEMARQALVRTRQYRPRFAEDGYHHCPLSDEMNVPSFSPTQATRTLFSQLYGVSIEAQLEVESLIRQGRLDLVQHIIHPNYDQSWYAANYIVPT